jgi:hypothetical protein
MIKSLLNKFSNILRIKQSIGALEISDLFLRYLNFDGENLIQKTIRLEPGILENGKIKDYNSFLEALEKLRNEIFNGKKTNKKLNILLSLSSVDIYTQIIKLPLIEDKNFLKTVELNLKMITPKEESKMYSSWQILKRDPTNFQVEILASFADKEKIDEFKKVLEEKKFVIRAIEFKTFSLVRFFREEVANFDNEKSYLIVVIDEDGVKNLIIKEGSFYFDHIFLWKDLGIDGKQIEWIKFETEFLRHIHQVINFYNSRFTEKLNGIFLITSEFGGILKDKIQTNFNLKVFDIILKRKIELTSEWIGCFGLWLRSKIPPQKDEELNLLGIEVREGFIENQVLAFFEFWRVILTFSFGMGLFILLASYLFLFNIYSSLKKESLAITSNTQSAEVKKFQTQVEQFNNLVKIIKEIEINYIPRDLILKKILSKTKENNIIIKNLSLDKNNLKMTALALSEESILSFKKSLEADQGFGAIDLPFSEIKSSDAGKIFSISFSVNLSNIK